MDSLEAAPSRVYFRRPQQRMTKLFARLQCRMQSARKGRFDGGLLAVAMAATSAVRPAPDPRAVALVALHGEYDTLAGSG